MLKELERVVLTVDLPKHRLRVGDVGVIVLVHGAGYALEVFTVDGKTYDVVTVDADQVRPIGELEIAQVDKSSSLALTGCPCQLNLYSIFDGLSTFP
ncbi:DUF4926 domain-containing protein [bacterium]|nr:DUF4926 domain-containing protein [bacterium]